MLVMILEHVPQGMRGELSRWMIEPHAGVFLGHVNAMVRDRLWELCCEACPEGNIIQLWSVNNEQQFDVRVFGNPRRNIVDYEGLKLVWRPLPESTDSE